MSIKRGVTIVSFGVILLAGIIFGAIISTQTYADKDKDESSAQSKFSGSALLTTNRDQLNICVDIATSKQLLALKEEDLSVMVKKIVKDDLPSTKEWQSKGFEGYRTEVSTNCKFEPFLTLEGVTHPIYRSYDGGRYVEEPSQYRFAVFVVDDEIIDRNFDPGSARWSPEEMLCEDNECNEVTSAIYLTEMDVLSNDGKQLIEEVKHMFGIDLPPKELPKNYIDLIQEKESRKNNK